MKKTLFAIAATAFVVSAASGAQAEPWSCSHDYFDARPCLSDVADYKAFVETEGLKINEASADAYVAATYDEATPVTYAQVAQSNQVAMSEATEGGVNTLARATGSGVQTQTPKVAKMGAPKHPRVIAAEAGNSDVSTLAEALGRSFEWNPVQRQIVRR